MEHVPTLCATGTVGIATAGFAFGRPQGQAPATSSRRRSTHSRNHSSQLDHSTRPSSFSPSQPGPFDAHAHAHAHRPPTSRHRRLSRSTVHASDKGGSSEIPEAWKDTSSSGMGLRPRRRTYVDHALKSFDDTNRESLSTPSSSRPSSSWIKRLSTIGSSLNEGSVSGSRPPTPSLHSSNSPLFPSHDIPPGPNKLVKRPTSQRGFPSPQTGPSAGLPPPTPVLRRPATSHQRSAATRQRSSTESRVAPSGIEITNQDTPIHDPKDTSCSSPRESWKPFFGLGRPCLERRSGRRSPSARQRNRSPRRLVPTTGDPPTLILATTIVPDSPFSDDSMRGGCPPSRSRPMSSSYTEGKLRSSDLPFAPTSGLGGRDRQPGLHTVEERIASTSPSMFKVPSAKTPPDDHSFVPASGERSTTEFQDFTRPIADAFHDGSARSPRRHGEHGFVNNPNDPMADETNLDQVARRSNAECEALKSSLRRVPSFVELRSGQAPAVSPPPEANSPPFPDKHQTDIRVSSASPGSMTNRARNQRHSAATSDPSSTVAGSDNDTRVFTSGDEDETDFQSETAFDSFSTRAANSSKSGRRGPRIETVFNPPEQTEIPGRNTLAFESSEANEDSLGALPGQPNNNNTHNDLTATPLPRALLSGSDNKPVSVMDTTRKASGSRESPFPSLASQQQISPAGSSTGEFFSFASRMEQDPSVPGQPNVVLSPSLSSTRSPSPASSSGRCEGDALKSLFDWSEQQNTSNGSESRPRTANAKQILDTRNGRSSSRGPSNSLHLRSQSVPIAKENTRSKESLKSTKFGTWGLGNKGATEDWDGDFEFDDTERSNPTSDGDGFEDLDVQTMKVPISIMERQESLHGQFGQVQELTVLVEELKRLRIRAKALDVLDGPPSELWREARVIISLATSEEGEESEPSSPDDLQTKSLSPAGDDFGLGWSSENQESKLAVPRHSYSKRSPLSERINPAISTMPPLRTDQSKCVLDSISQQCTATHDNDFAADPQQKMPFDTQSLRDLVVRAGAITRSLKEIVRRAEGVCVLDDNGPEIPDPPFRKIFSRPHDDSVPLEIQI